MLTPDQMQAMLSVMKLSAVAREVGVSRQTVASLADGRGGVSYELARRVSDYLESLIKKD